MKTIYITASMIVLALVSSTAGSEAPANELSVFDKAELELRYSIGYGQDDTPMTGDMGTDLFNEDDGPKRKSPFKAFVLSLAVPGLGQWYYGNRWKPFVFAGAEALSWYLHVQYDKDGDELTDEFEAFNDANWSRERYEDEYLQWAYGWNDDDSANTEPDCNCPEISHHLPETKTQQYYEMTGKYDQFAWGWADARLQSGETLDSFSVTDPPPRIKPAEPPTVPQSAMRDMYNTMRFNADEKYDNSTKMLYVIIANHLVSAFEAYLTTRSINEGLDKDPSEFSRIKVTPELRSYHSWKDTPMVRFSYQF